MIIKRLSLNNFGVYSGNNTFCFNNQKPIVLIGGMNGRGKTTFLSAILIALYGDNSVLFRESNYKSYNQYLRSYVNNNNLDETTFVELEFQINEPEPTTYLSHREWDAQKKRTKETITVYQNGEYNEFITNNWTMFVETIIPNALSGFYFFDGEKIAEMAVDNTSKQLKESIRAMLGISVLDVLKNDLVKNVRKISKESGSGQKEDELEQLRRDNEMLEQLLAQTEYNIELKANTIAELDEKIDKQYHRYQAQGGSVYEQREELLQNKAILNEKLGNISESLVLHASESLPLLMVKDLLDGLMLDAKTEYDSHIMQQATDQVLSILEEYKSTHALSNNEYNDFIELVNRRANSAKEQVYQLSDHTLFQLEDLLNNELPRQKAETIKLLESKSKTIDEEQAVESHLQLDISSDTLAKITNIIKKLSDDKVKEEVELSHLESERHALENELDQKTADYHRAVESYLQSVELVDDNDRLLKYSNMAIRLVEKYSIALQAQKTEYLARTITDCYKQLANKSNMIDNIRMDHETLDISYYNGQGLEVAKESLSAGEKQLTVISILWALAICSGKKLPVIIDTPLSRMDSQHRTALITTYFPQASEQTIILSTDSEIDRTYYELMKKDIGDEFTLEYEDEVGSTRILRGYFEVME